MATVGGILSYVAVYGLFILGSMSFFFNPNVITLLVFVFTMWLFLNKRSRNDKEEKK
jgi:CHASE2 domain-containing sensor protein